MDLKAIIKAIVVATDPIAVQSIVYKSIFILFITSSSFFYFLIILCIIITIHTDTIKGAVKVVIPNFIPIICNMVDNVIAPITHIQLF